MNKFEYKNLTPFKWFVLENFPFLEADFDALTEWELFCKLGKEINKIITSENTLGTQVENVTNAFIELQNYVNNYFNNLDVQEEINNKLNQMVENGSFNIILKNLVGNIVNIKDFGALGDGITDDTIAIQDAINTLNSGDTLLIPEGNYKISPTTKYNIEGYGNYNPYYGVLIENKNNIKIECKGMLLPDISINPMNCFAIKNCKNIVVTGLQGEYNGSVTVNDGTVHLKNLIHVNKSSEIIIEKCIAKNIGGCCSFVACSNSLVYGCKASRTSQNYRSPALFGIYASNSINIDNCVGYGGTNDGDISLFGGADKCNVTNCKIFAYLEETKLIENNTMQGICVDSGSDYCTISNNYVEGYYYGIDVKTDCVGVIVTTNQCIRNKVGIASRLGEGNQVTLDTLITNNDVFPNGGNGNTTVIYDTFYIVGIMIQNSNGVSVDGNSIRNDYRTTVNANFLPIYAVNTISTNESLIGVTNIINNIISLHSAQGSNNSLSNSPAMVVRGSETFKFKNVNISNNNFKNQYTNNSPYYTIVIENLTHSLISNNSFNVKPTSNGYININNCTAISVLNNKFERARRNILITNSQHIQINSNYFMSSGEYLYTIEIENCDYISLKSNYYIGETNEGGACKVSNCNNVVANENTCFTSKIQFIFEDNEAPSTNISQENNTFWTRP